VFNPDYLLLLLLSLG